MSKEQRVKSNKMLTTHCSLLIAHYSLLTTHCSLLIMKEIFTQLGQYIGNTAAFENLFARAYEQNSWFTPANLTYACQTWAKTLTEENISQWLSAYDLRAIKPKRVLIVMAGNVPLVGFHDLLCVLASGHQAVVKLSSDDKVLLPHFADYLKEIAPKIGARIEFTEERTANFDAVIATGSNNTARYFEYYFGNKPHIIRKNRHSVAVLTGEETQQQLFALGRDIFQYYGLGCRSVSKLFVPEDYNFDLFFKAIYPYKDLIEEQKYANNYDYNKAVYLMSLFKLLENGFLILKEDTHYGSPIATLFYEYYTDINQLKARLAADAEQLQCVVSSGFSNSEVPFGTTQQPALWDYADGVDPREFLIELSASSF